MTPHILVSTAKETLSSALTLCPSANMMCPAMTLMSLESLQNLCDQIPATKHREESDWRQAVHLFIICVSTLYPKMALSNLNWKIQNLFLLLF